MLLAYPVCQMPAETRHTSRRPTTIAALALVACILAGTYGAPLALAYALDASVVRVSLYIDDGRRDPPSKYFLSVKFWGLCVRLEWLTAHRGHGGVHD
jgi:uncharacterized iron-regulated membrane protein